MKKYLLVVSAFLVLSCNTDDKAVDVVFEEVFQGAFLRTVAVNNLEFDVNDPNSVFSVVFEEQDPENGELLDFVDVFVWFDDNTAELGDLSTTPVLLERLDREAFTPGPGAESLPRTTLECSFSELQQAAGIPMSNIACKDQFVIVLELQLTDGTRYTQETANALILANNTFFSSPFTYTVTVVEPIDPEFFTGDYSFVNVLNGPLGPSFIPEGPSIEITPGHSPNTRFVKLLYHISRRPARTYEFTIACDEIFLGKNQLSSTIGKCRPDQPDTGDLILLGPDNENWTITPGDDSVFELWFVEGYRAWDGDCGFDSVPSRIRFSKQ